MGPCEVPRAYSWALETLIRPRGTRASSILRLLSWTRTDSFVSSSSSVLRLKGVYAAPG